MRLRTLVGMALRELWISFRMIPTVGLPIVAGMVVTAVPAELWGASAIGTASLWYAVGAGIAICLIGAFAASTLAHERRRGTLAWMSVRAVPRSTVLVGWFAGYALLLVVGIGLGSVGAWLAAISRAEAPIDPIPFIAAIVAVACTALAVLAAGLCAGTLLGRWPAGIVVLLGAGVFVAAVILGPQIGAEMPANGIGLLADLGASERPIGDALRSSGTALSFAGLLLVVAAAMLERADL